MPWYFSPKEGLKSFQDEKALVRESGVDSGEKYVFPGMTLRKTAEPFSQKMLQRAKQVVQSKTGVRGVRRSQEIKAAPPIQKLTIPSAVMKLPQTGRAQTNMAKLPKRSPPLLMREVTVPLSLWNRFIIRTVEGGLTALVQKLIGAQSKAKSHAFQLPKTTIKPPNKQVRSRHAAMIRRLSYRLNRWTYTIGPKRLMTALNAKKTL